MYLNQVSASLFVHLELKVPEEHSLNHLDLDDKTRPQTLCGTGVTFVWCTDIFNVSLTLPRYCSQARLWRPSPEKEKKRENAQP